MLIFVRRISISPLYIRYSETLFLLSTANEWQDINRTPRDQRSTNTIPS